MSLDAPLGAAPLVSVVMPAYNAAATLRSAVDSVLAQRYQNIELIVIDDGSTDATAELLRDYGDRLQFRSQPNTGLAGARNAGLARARGDLIALFDADDLCHPDRVAMQVAVLQAFPDVVLASGAFEAFDADGPIAGFGIGEYYSAVAATPGGLRALYGNERQFVFDAGVDPSWRAPCVYFGRVDEAMVWGSFVHPPTVMFRRALIDGVGAFSRNLRNLGDYDWLMRAARCGVFAHVDLPLIRYRLSEGQMSGDRNTVQVKLDLIEMLAALRRDDPQFCKRHAGRFARRIALAYVGAAEALRETDRARAWRLWLSGCREHVLPAAAMRVACKLAIPDALLNGLRGARRGLRSATR